MSENAVVQIICVTYNQKDYIKAAMDSFLMQKTNFKFEVFIGDDCSTDGTSDIVAEYARKYPDIIKHFKRNPNMGCLANFMDLCSRITAKYAAFCDGDDYWTDEYKLQKQFDFLEKHKEVNICSHRVKVDVNQECSLYNFYARLKDPFIYPAKLQYNKYLTIKDVAEELPSLSSVFIRWKKIDFPDWATKNGKYGDFPVIFLQLGEGKLYIFKEPMGVYRKNDSGVIFDKTSAHLYFIKSRLEYFKILSKSIEYFEENYNSYGIEGIKKRLDTEIYNYINSILATDRWDLLDDVKAQYPEVYKRMKYYIKTGYVCNYNYCKLYESKKSFLLRKMSFIKMLAPIVNTVYYYHVGHSVLKSLHAFFGYWLFAIVPKKKNLWIFSGFQQENYSDNSKHLFEYIVKHHPEIKPVWMTKSKILIKDLKEAKMPVCKMNSLKGIWLTARAEYAFSDYYKILDYDNRYGFNARTKFINLWHGLEIDDYKNEKDFFTNKFEGNDISSDILINASDSFWRKRIKHIKYFFFAPFRELFEKYSGFLCATKELKELYVKKLGINEKACIVATPPRASYYTDNPLQITQNLNVLYYPYYNCDLFKEQQKWENLFAHIELINKLASDYNLKFHIKMNFFSRQQFNNMVMGKLSNNPNIIFEKKNDLYEFYNNYSLVISDSLSVLNSFAVLGVPNIYINTQGKDTYGVNINYQTENQDEAFELLKKLVENNELQNLRKNSSVSNKINDLEYIIKKCSNEL